MFSSVGEEKQLLALQDILAEVLVQDYRAISQVHC